MQRKRMIGFTGLISYSLTAIWLLLPSPKSGTCPKSRLILKRALRRDQAGAKCPEAKGRNHFSITRVRPSPDAAMGKGAELWFSPARLTVRLGRTRGTVALPGWWFSC